MTEVDVAIGMILLGAAVTVRLCNLEAGEEAAFDAAARAQAANVGFTLKRDGPRSITMIVGPRLPELADAPAPAPEARA